MLAPFEKDLNSAGIDPLQLQNMIKSMFTQIKRDARDAQQLKSLFDPMRAMLVFCVLGKPEGRS